MKSREKSFWWSTVGLCSLLQLGRIIEPSLADRPTFKSIQLFALATIIAIAVTALIVCGGLHGRSEKNKNATTTNVFGREKVVTIVGYSTYYRTQKRVAVIFSILIWAILGFSYRTGVLEYELFSLLLPISLIGPGLYIRDRLKEALNR